ncbi:MAG: nucleotide sugar dehydrogenase [Lachnospiraceae bacterium]|nr:nucleotide sugar dehydrogenase [Lachnospiraceae bacterium]MBQ8665920.1 nucleotide sugar dehydrogenase [Lachnospiraceae bacterium]
MSLYEDIKSGKEKIALVGLGYVGMPIAVAFAKKAKVVGFDLNKEKIAAYKSGKDATKEVGDEAISKTTVEFTSDPEDLKGAKFHIVAVPTPINQDKTPDLYPVESASEILGRNLTKGSIVVYESTVYPGVTEDICVPILEKESGLKCGVDFKIGYSPERINPGDKVHRLENIKKIVSGMDAETLEEVANVYELVIEAGVHRAGSIKVAEAAKVVENSQRDINIAFINELAMAFDKMGIDTNEVIDAMNTKWNALGFRPGLVGGHCIGVDPYYFVYEAERLGYHSRIISAGRQINDDMPNFVGEQIVKQLVLAGKKVRDAKIVFFGATFKENCPDVRNSKIMEILKYLEQFEMKPLLVDTWADPAEVKRGYGYDLDSEKNSYDADCIVLAVAHEGYKNRSLKEWDSFFKPGDNSEKVIIDIKGILDNSEVTEAGYRYWRL